jgi:hypothetical protein
MLPVLILVFGIPLMLCGIGAMLVAGWKSGFIGTLIFAFVFVRFLLIFERNPEEVRKKKELKRLAKQQTA